MIRVAEGNDDHPDSARFPFLYKLLSIYSLLKVPKGNNVNNDEVFSTFCHITKENKIFGKEESRTFSAKDIRLFAGKIEDNLADPENNDLELAEQCTIEHFGFS